MRRLVLGVLLCWALAAPVGAQGNAAPTLSALHVLYVPHDDGTVTGVFQFSVRGETPNALNVDLTLPLDGTLVDATVHEDNRLFDTLDSLTFTAPDYIPPPCDLSPTITAGIGPSFSDYRDVAASMSVSADPGDDSVNVRLSLSAYTLKGIEQDSYGNVLHVSPLLAVRFRPNDGAIVLHSPARTTDALYVRPRTTLPTQVYLLGESGYAPLNAPLVDVDLSAARTATETATILRATDVGPYGGTPRDDYQRSLVAALGTATGRNAFARMHIGEADRTLAEPLRGVVGESPTATTLTRLSGRVIAEEPAVQFAPDPTVLPVTTDLTALIDPIAYYGCTTEGLYDPELEAQLTQNRPYISGLRTHLPLPDGWPTYEVSYTGTSGITTARTIATPAQVDDDTLAFLRGGLRDVPVQAPVLDVFAFQVRYVGEFDAQPTITTDPALYRGFNAPFPTVGANAVVQFWPHADTAPIDMYGAARQSDAPPVAHGIKARLLAPLDDYAANVALYDDMLRYFNTLQFYTHPNLRHTLFLGELAHHLHIGYPEGWAVNFGAPGQWQIAPEDTIGARVVITEVNVYDEDLFAFAAAQTGLTAAVLEPAFGQPVPFNTGAVQGWVALTQGMDNRAFVVRFEADATADAASVEQLATMASAVRFEVFAGEVD